MKKLIILLLIAFSIIKADAQTIISSLPVEGATITFPDDSHVRVAFKAILDKKVRAVVFSVDPRGVVKVQRGKNNVYTAGFTEWPQFVDGKYVYELTLILDKIEAGDHTYRIDVHSELNKIVETKEVTFTISYFNQ